MAGVDHKITLPQAHSGLLLRFLGAKHRAPDSHRASPKKLSRGRMHSEQLKSLVIDALNELKAVDVTALDVGELSGFTDYMVIAGGTSSRHVKSLADNLLRRCRKAGVRPLGVEGERAAEWILVDLGDVVIHIMLPEVRDFYNLEKLWRMVERDDQAQYG